MRNTKQKEIIYSVLKNCCDHPSADVVYERARRISPKISLGTVYRNLGKMCDAGDILSIESRDKSIRYDGNTKPHLHFVCDECGAIIDLFGDFCVSKPFEGRGFIVKEAKLVFYGTCKTCAEKIKNI